MSRVDSDQWRGSAAGSLPSMRRAPEPQGWGGRRLVVLMLWGGLLVSKALWWLDTPSQSPNNRGELLVAGGRITGLVAGYLLLLQVLLRSRLGVFERWVGTEALTRWH